MSNNSYTTYIQLVAVKYLIIIIISFQLNKPPGSNLGLSVVGLRSEIRGELGIYVQGILPNGLAGR